MRVLFIFPDLSPDITHFTGVSSPRLGALATLGVQRMNLGGTPEDAPGLTAYKRRWGGQTYRCQRHVLTSGLGSWL
jgi:hypothetical protein